MSFGAKRFALVTGGRARVGLAIARRLAADGYEVVIHSGSDPDGARRASESVNGGPDPVWICDLADPERALASFEAEALPRFPGLDLVLNASAFENDPSAGEVSPALLRRMSSIHFETSAALISSAARNGAGQAVALLDQNVENLHGDFLAYCMSKSALHAAIPRLALALAPFRVNAVAPGPVLPLPEADLAKFEAACSQTPLGHCVSPEDIAESVAFLLKARSVTGQTLFVDAGQRLRQWSEPAA